MADYKVGNLQIAFEAINNTSTDFKEVAKALRSLQKLILNIANADISKFSNNLSEVTKDLYPFLDRVEQASFALKELNVAFERFGLKSLSSVTTASTDFSNLAQAVEETTNATEDFNGTVNSGERQISETKNIIKGIWETFSNDTIKSTLDLEKQRQQLLKNKIAFLELKIANNDTSFSIQELRKELQKLQNELGNNEEATTKGANGWKKFIKSIGRIALYRAIRRVLQLITQSITETIQEFAKLDDNVNNTMSQITSSLQVIKLSFGATFLPFLEAIAPILNQIAISLSDFANTISQAFATGDTYWAINAQAIRDYREQLEKTTGSLASFDKIQSLNAKDTFTFFEEREVDKEKRSVQALGDTLSIVRDIIKDLLWLLDKGVLGTIKSVILGISTVVSVLKDMGLQYPALALVAGVLAKMYGAKVITGLGKLVTKLGTVKVGILAVFAAIGLLVQVIENWGNMTTIQKIIGILGVLTTACLGAALALGAFHSAWSIGLATAGIIAGIVAVTAAVNSAKKSASNPISYGVRAMADGGIPSVGTLFYAGEAGAETVTVGNSGRTEVTNVSQMETALYNALVRYGRENRSNGETIPIYIDGQKVFEATRRVANRRGLDFSKV